MTLQEERVKQGSKMDTSGFQERGDSSAACPREGGGERGLSNPSSRVVSKFGYTKGGDGEADVDKKRKGETTRTIH